MKVLLTGATGFVGSAVCQALCRKRADVVALTRSVPPERLRMLSGTTFVQMTEGLALPEILPDLTGAAIIHLAARVHIMRDSSPEGMEAYRETNVRGTVELARAAAGAGARRFIYMSSVKVNGERTGDAPFRETDLPHPVDPYGVSKWEAEQALVRISAETGMEVVILRPPLVYGPHVKANFLRLLRWVDHGIPLPLASVRNRRSMIYLGNLVDAIITCIDHPAVAGHTYLLSDGEDVSTPDLIRRMAMAFGKSARLWPLPAVGLRTLGALSGKRAEVERLLDSLQVDSSQFRQDAGWQPPFTLAQGVAQTVNWYRGIPE